MEGVIKELISIILRMGMENSHGLMGKFIKVCGLKENKTEMVNYILVKVMFGFQVNGKMEKELKNKT
jgi:hypothetical protein